MDSSHEAIKAITRLIELFCRYWRRIWFSFFDLLFWLYYLIPGNKSMKWSREVFKYFLRVKLIGTLINWAFTHYFATATTSRPRPYSLWSAQEKNPSSYPTPLPDPMASSPPSSSYGPVSDYTSWNSLTNKKFSARHLPPKKEDSAVALEEIVKLFQRPGSDPKLDRSSVLFSFFAQWFTDSFMRVDPIDRRKNTSTHDIDLCQIYGLDEETCYILRKKSNGLLWSQDIDGEEFPDYLGEIIDGQWAVKTIYKKLPYADRVDQILGPFAGNISRKSKLYATGLERGNSSIGYVALSTLFLRQHNSICRELVAEYGDPKKQGYAEWNDPNDSTYFDERVFQTARMVNMVILLKLVVEEYINHVAGNKVFKLDYGFAEELSWYRTNWVTIEFDLLYRWHSLVLDEIKIDNKLYKTHEYRFNNGKLEDLGLKKVIEGTSAQQAGRIGLWNTPEFLWKAEAFGLKMAREFKLKNYNDYREKFSLRRLKSIEDLVGNKPEDQALLAELNRLYDHDINKVEYLVGIFAEKRESPALFGELMYNMVSYDAFTHIYTNPLLSKHIFNENTFTKIGMDIIKDTTSLQKFVQRNTGNSDVKVSFSAKPPTH